jgi:hypothetical protein
MLVLLFAADDIQGQSPSGTTIGEDRSVSASERKEIVDSVNALLMRMYVFPDKAKATADLMNKNLRSGKYDTCKSISLFTQLLTRDMQQLTRDGHLSVFPADAPPVGSDSTATAEESRSARFAFGKTVNFGFQQVELLSGNIGYLNLKGFFPADVAAPTAIAAMNFVAHCNALIIDLRENGGGDPSMIQLISSYFFNESVHLNNFFDRRNSDTTQFWTQVQVTGPRMANTPVYVLTSQNSFSAAEEFAYNLKQLKRATTIGEATGGGAHPNDFIHFPNLKVTVSVAWGRAFNPITGTNWEGVGVEPDIKVTADKALAVAQLLIFDSLIVAESDSLQRQVYEWSMQTLECDTLAFQLSAEKVTEYAGNYSPRHISVEDGRIFYRRDNNPKALLIPIAPDLFQHSKSEFFRIKFLRDSQGTISGLVGLYQDGRREENKKVN